MVHGTRLGPAFVPRPGQLSAPGGAQEWLCSKSCRALCTPVGPSTVPLTENPRLSKLSRNHWKEEGERLMENELTRQDPAAQGESPTESALSWSPSPRLDGHQPCSAC